MKPLSILAPVILLLNYGNYGKCEYPPPAYPPYPPGPPPRGLGFQESVNQAKRQLKTFYARDIPPVKASISNLDDYYHDIEEKELQSRPHRFKLARKPCKVLPDPEPGLVNPKLVDPVHKFHPIHKNEKFYGEFAPPVKVDYPGRPGFAPVPLTPARAVVVNDPNVRYPVPAYQAANAQNPYPYPRYLQYPAPNPLPDPYPEYPKYKKKKRNDPFDGYRGRHRADKDYYQTEIIDERLSNWITPTTTYNLSTVSVNTASWQSQLSEDYSKRLASMSSALYANSAALSSMSVSAKWAARSMSWASKEASLRSKMAEYSATATAKPTRKSWRW